jgi:voltage-gated potassium channel
VLTLVTLASGKVMVVFTAPLALPPNALPRFYTLPVVASAPGSWQDPQRSAVSAERLRDRDLRRRDRLNIVIFGTESIEGRAFDVALLVVIVLSVLVVMLDSVAALREQHRPLFATLEWIFTALFTIEYGLRIYSARIRTRYLFSFFGIVDLLAVLPSYLALFMAGTEVLMVVRVLRLLRVFRVLKIVRMLGEANSLMRAIRQSLPKIGVFLGAVITIVIIAGAIMHLVEGPAAGFTSIPRSMYWAIVTLTTVGYGDIAPVTPLGQALAALLMITGYGVIAVPTGIVSAELVYARRETGHQMQCPSCATVIHADDANYCRICGTELV